MYMSSSTTATQTKHSFRPNYLFQSGWRPTNRLKLNPSKSQFLRCTTLRRRRLLDYSTFPLDDTEIRQADTTATLESTLTAVWLWRLMWVNPFYQLRRIKTICKFISTLTAVILVNSFIVSRVDYCSSILAELQTCQLNRIQSVLNSSAGLI